MSIYKVSYIDGHELKFVHISGSNETEAGKIFSQSHREVPANAIISVEAYNPVEPQKTQLKGIDISLWQMTLLSVKVGIAVIPGILVYKAISMLLAMFGLSFLTNSVL